EYVESHDDLQLAVRIHPREGPNKREGGTSQHLQKLRREFGAYQHARVRIIWPEDKTSSYDLGEAADLALVSWSSIGLELARLGVPVLTSTRGIGFLPEGDFLAFRAA